MTEGCCTMVHMKFFRLLFVLLLSVAAFAQDPAPPQAAATARREVWEAVVSYQGKAIGTNILLEIGPTGAVRGWIQRNDYFPIDSGQADSEHIKFGSGANSYDINLRTERISYSGPDGSGNQRATKMTAAQGMVYKLAEPMSDDEAILTLRNEDGDRSYAIGEPSIWKRAAAPIDHLEFERWKDILGKTTTLYISKFGSTRIVSVMEEPEGMDLVKHPPKDKNKKDKKKK